MNESLETLLADGIIEAVIGQLKTGKEAEVWLVQHAGQVVAAKLYKERHERNFRNNVGYKEGREVRNSRTRRAMEKGSRFGQAAAEDAWKSAESDSLYKLHAQGVRVPTPVMFYEGILLMELVLDPEGHPAPRLVEAPPATPEDAQALYLDLRSQVVNMLCADLIHGDLSPYNILMSWQGPTIIDFPQTVAAARNNRAEFYFRRDLDNVRNFLAGFAPWLQGMAGDTGEIWNAYVRRELTPEFTPSGTFREGPRRGGAGRGPRAGGFRPERPEPVAVEVAPAAPQPAMTPEEAAEAELRELEALVLKQGGGERGKPAVAPPQRGGRNRFGGGRPPPRAGGNRPAGAGGGNGARPPQNGQRADGARPPQGGGNGPRPPQNGQRPGGPRGGNGRPGQGGMGAQPNEARGGGNGRPEQRGAGAQPYEPRGGGNGRPEQRGAGARPYEPRGGGNGRPGQGERPYEPQGGNERPGQGEQRGAGTQPYDPRGDGNGPQRGVGAQPSESRGGNGRFPRNGPRGNGRLPPNEQRGYEPRERFASSESGMTAPEPGSGAPAHEARSEDNMPAQPYGPRGNGRPPRNGPRGGNTEPREGSGPPARHEQRGGNGRPGWTEQRGGNGPRPPRDERRGGGPGRSQPVVETRPAMGTPMAGGAPEQRSPAPGNAGGAWQQRPPSNRGGPRQQRSGPQVSFVSRPATSSDPGPHETGS